MANRGRGRGRHSWSRGLQQLVPEKRTWHRAAGQPSVPGCGQSWDPFRPVQDSQPSPVPSEVLPASGSRPAYTRRSLSKLVLEKQPLEVALPTAQNIGKEGVPHHTGQPVPLAREPACSSHPPAALAVHVNKAREKHRAAPAAAERRVQKACQGVAAADRPQPMLSKSSIAVRHPRKIWQRQSVANSIPAKQPMLQAARGVGSCTRSSVSAVQQRANTWQRQPQSPGFARRRENQIVRLSSGSPAWYSSVLLRSGFFSLPRSAAGSRRHALNLPIARSARAGLPMRSHVAASRRALVSARVSSCAGPSPTVLVRRGNKLVRVSWSSLSVPIQACRNLSKPSTQGVPPTAKLQRSQNQLQRPTQLRRIGSVMYRVGKSSTGSHSLQRTETPRRILMPARSASSGMLLRPQTPRYARRAGKLVRISTPAAALLKPAAMKIATGAKATAAARLLKQAQMQRHPASVYSRQPLVQGSSAPPRQSALCPAFCRTGKCEGQRKGQCRLRHDPGWVTVCSKWLHGSCTTLACPLQHAASPDVMPLCMFHLKGQCSKVSCIYSHKELPASSGVCRAYAAGFCPKGQACTQKHLTPRMLRELRASRTLRAGDAEVAAFKSQPSSNKQGISEAVEASLEPEDGSKKRKWRYFWAEEEGG